MAGLGSTYITINSNALPETSSFSIHPQVIETVHQTEAGTDTGTVIRTGKFRMNCGWERVDDTFRALAEGFCADATVSVVFDSVTRTMRARNLREDLIRYSNRYDGSKGLWNISFELEEI